MADIKAISKKYNDEDVYEVNDADIKREVEKYAPRTAFEIIANLGQLQVTSEGGSPEAYFSWDETIGNKLKEYNLIIFTMNNSFVITPLATSGETLACGNFVYDSNGNSMVARLRIGDAGLLFDESFSYQVNESGITPYGLLVGIKL